MAEQGRRLRVRPRQPNLRGPRETPPGPTPWVRPATGWWERMKAGESPWNQGRSNGRPCPFPEGGPEVKGKRRSGAPKGAPVRVMGRQSRPQTGEAMPQGGPMGAAFRAREFRRSASLFIGTAKGSKPTIWHDSPPGCAARQRSRTVQTHSQREDDVEIAEPNIDGST